MFYLFFKISNSTIMNKLFFIPLLFPLFTSCQEDEIANLPDEPTNSEIMYTMPEESAPHEGTWLQWPHQYQYGVDYRNDLDQTWVAMTQSLIGSEKVHLVAYDTTEKNRITDLLNSAGISLSNIEFKIYKTDDVWARDNGPIYVRDKNGKLVIQDWGFNGWGKKAAFTNCNTIPTQIAADQGIEVVNLNTIMINEGGAVEIDGNGTLLATKSAILNSNRNPGMTQAQAEAIFKKNLGTSHFIWLEGKAGREITDMHIDGFARFGNTNTIVTMNENDLLYWEVPQTDINTLYTSKNKNGIAYTFLKLPLSKNEVITTYGKKLGYKGSYVNYYIANTVVLVPNYNDPNDAVANQLIQNLYPTRKVIGIDVRNLYANGGMIHCVTQQQPK
jgi:agmatine deiminase